MSRNFATFNLSHRIKIPLLGFCVGTVQFL